MLLLKICKTLWLGLLLLALVGLHYLSAAPARAVGDGYQPADNQHPGPAAQPGLAVRLVNSRLLLDELRAGSTSERPNLGRKALPRARWHLVPGPVYLLAPLPRSLDAPAAQAAKLHKI